MPIHGQYHTVLAAISSSLSSAWCKPSAAGRWPCHEGRQRYTAVPEARKASDELIVRHAELVKRIAYHMAGRLPPSVDVDDLIQAGMVGLMEAASNWSMNRGASFETYAGIRIRGAMIDALRKLDWAPRSVHRQARAVAAAVREIEQSTGREARDAEVAQHMGVTLEEYHQALQDAAVCQLASLDDDKAGDHFADDADPFRDAADEQFRAALTTRSATCPSASAW